MKKRIGQMILISCMLIGIAGCGRTPEGQETDTPAEVSSGDQAGDDSRTGSASGSDSADVVGQGFRPPEGSHRDSRGYVVDPEGNTFDDDGGWQVPEGGWVDSKGRIHDKNGNLMGGGAIIGSKG